MYGVLEDPYKGFFYGVMNDNRTWVGDRFTHTQFLYRLDRNAFFCNMHSCTRTGLRSGRHTTRNHKYFRRTHKDLLWQKLPLQNSKNYKELLKTLQNSKYEMDLNLTTGLCCAVWKYCGDLWSCYVSLYYWILVLISPAVVLQTAIVAAETNAH